MSKLFMLQDLVQKAERLEGALGDEALDLMRRQKGRRTAAFQLALLPFRLVWVSEKLLLFQ